MKDLLDALTNREYLERLTAALPPSACDAVADALVAQPPGETADARLVARILAMAVAAYDSGVRVGSGTTASHYVCAACGHLGKNP